MVDFLAASKKAVAGFVAAAVLAYFAKHGLNADVTLGTLVNTLASGVVGFVVVWLSPANKV